MPVATQRQLDASERWLGVVVVVFRQRPRLVQRLRLTRVTTTGRCGNRQRAVLVEVAAPAGLILQLVFELAIGDQLLGVRRATVSPVDVMVGVARLRGAAAADAPALPVTHLHEFLDFSRGSIAR